RIGAAFELDELIAANGKLIGIAPIDKLIRGNPERADIVLDQSHLLETAFAGIGKAHENGRLQLAGKDATRGETFRDQFFYDRHPDADPHLRDLQRNQSDKQRQQESELTGDTKAPHQWFENDAENEAD